MEAARELASGQRPTGQRGLDGAHLGVLITGQEAHRNSRTLITAAMILDMADRGHHVSAPAGTAGTSRLNVDTSRRMSGLEALKLLPMAPQRAMEEARQLDAYLETWARTPSGERAGLRKRAGAQRLAEREIAAVRVWVRSLDVKTSTGKELETFDELKEQLRERAYSIYGLQ
jgi:hypothetical protein